MASGIQTSEINVGARRVFWGPAASETELGVTSEGSVLRISQEQIDVQTEEYGASPVTKILAGERVTCELTLLQWDSIQLSLVLPGGTQSGGTSYKFGKQGGVNLSATTYAKRLWLHPITQTDTTDQTEAIFIHLAIPQVAPIEARFNNEEPSAIGVIFEGIVDTSQSDGALLGEIRTA